MKKQNLLPLHGNLPKHREGPNIGRIDRKATARLYGITINQLFKAYWNWQDVFRFEGSDLTFKQYLDKMTEAGLNPSDIGNREGQYNLSRYGDEGVYSNDNCRFITREENLKEQFASMV